MLHLYAERRAARALPEAARRRRTVPVGRPHRARGRRQRPDPDADDRLPRRRRVGHQRPQVVHVGRVAGRVHDGVRQDRARRREAHAVQLDHRPDRHARLPHPAGRADDGPRRRPALRGRLRQRARAAHEPARQPRRGLPDQPEAARPGPHLPLHALARPGPAGLRADVRAGPRRATPTARCWPRRARSRR